MNWPQTIAFGIAWLVLGVRLLEQKVPAVAKVSRPVERRLLRDRY